MGIYSVMDYSTAPGLTLADGFDWEPAATETVQRRHGIPMRNLDARRLFNSGIAGLQPTMRLVDIVFSGSPCQRASWAPHFNMGTEPNADDPMNALYPDQVHTIVQHAEAALIEFLMDVKKLRSPAGSPNEARQPGWRHDGMLANFAQHGWVTRTRRAGCMEDADGAGQAAGRAAAE